MATQAEIEQHRSALDDILTLAAAELVTEWDGLPEAPDGLRAVLPDLLVELTADFSAMAAALAADFYEELRSQTLLEPFTAFPAEMVPVEQIRSCAEYASAAAHIESGKALRDAAASLERLVAQRDRDTIDLNVERDPVGPRYARHASANACAFCAMNALRGPVYRSEDTAAKKYHDHCRCIAVPSWTRDDYTEAPYVANWREAYHAATDALGGATDPKAILAHMRQTTDLR